jgi:adenine-specific DNA methylase
MLMALLLPDPCDPHCPEEFKKKARQILLSMHGRPMGWEKKLKTNEELREIVLQFIGDFANWDNSANPNYLETARALVKAAHPEETPLVVDPFAGGGSIPLEALRLGCEAFASDLNPVACLILKVMLEDIPRHGPELADELRRVGDEINKKAEKELAEFYPKDPDGATPIAYLWARTVKCEAPNCGAEIPLMRSFWLCRKVNRRRALRYKVIRSNGKPPRVEFNVFEPKSENEVLGRTVARAKATCPCCNIVLPPDRVRSQLAVQRGGADAIFDAKGNKVGGARMLAVVTLRPGETGRHYRLPSDCDYKAVWNAQKRLKGFLDKWERDGKKGLCPVPDEPTPAGGGSGAGRAFSVQKYGMMKFGDLFTARQKVALVALARQMAACSNCNHVSADHELLSVVVSRCSSFWSSLNMWVSTGEFVANVFGRQALPIVWDFCEVFPVSTESGGFGGAVDWVARVIEAWPAQSKIGQVQIADATEHPLPGETVSVYFTDPPYYDAIPYSDLSDFFMAWLKRTLYDHPLIRDPFDSENPLSPKTREVVQDETKRFDGRTKDKAFFEERMGKAFAEGRRVLIEDGIGSVVFAHKTTEGWEALLTGMIHAGWTISGSWPIATERPGRLRSQDSAALATSVHLVCRPRPNDAPVGDWGQVLRELPKRVGDWMDRLQREGIRGADLVFACIGPALEIYSRYSKVVDPDEKDIPLGGDPVAKEPHKRGFLAYVWETVGRIALGQVLGTAEARARNGMAEALEEDARLTALFLWTLQSTNGHNGSGQPVEASAQAGGEPDEESEEDSSDADDEETAPKGKSKGYSLVLDVVRRFAQPLGIELPKWEGRIIETKKGLVRLMTVSERTKQLFGDDGADAVAELIERDPVKNLQQVLFPEFEEEQAPKIRGRGRGRHKVTLDPSAVEGDSIREATTLDRVHAAMLLQAGGQSNALRALIKAEQERGPDFIRLANALSALYPKKSEEKRLLDAMLLAVQR